MEYKDFSSWPAVYELRFVEVISAINVLVFTIFLTWNYFYGRVLVWLGYLSPNQWSLPGLTTQRENKALVNDPKGKQGIWFRCLVGAEPGGFIANPPTIRGYTPSFPVH